jgi:hypothetical protein
VTGEIFEYDVDCEACGRTFTIGLSVPAEAIEPDSLARIVDSVHAATCTVDVRTGGRL